MKISKSEEKQGENYIHDKVLYMLKDLSCIPMPNSQDYVLRGSTLMS